MKSLLKHLFCTVAVVLVLGIYQMGQAAEPDDDFFACLDSCNLHWYFQVLNCSGKPACTDQAWHDRASCRRSCANPLEPEWSIELH